MKGKYLVIAGLLLIGLTLALAACQQAAPEATPCPTAAPCPDCPTCPTAPACPEAAPCPEPVVKDVPYQDAWVNSPHNQADAEAFVHWNAGDPAEVPVACATCHTTAGYQDFLGADGSAAGVVDAAVPAPAGTIQCAACHNAAASSLTSVKFPYTFLDEEGNKVQKEITGLGDSARCMVCHQGRAAKSSVDNQIAAFNVTDLDAPVAPIKEGDTERRFGFINIHYYAAAATLYGTEVKGGYEYDGKMYDAKHDHVEGFATCTGCHDAHSLEVKVEQCAICHNGVATVEDLKNVREPSSMMDYDGDGDVAEGMFYEIQGLQEKLFQAIQTYAKEVAGVGIVYDSAAYPYFFADADGDGAPDKNDQGGNVAYSAWTARLLKAAYNYQVSYKDPGAFAHGNKYIVQLVYDSIEDLNAKLATPVDLSAAHRDDAGHFAGNTMAFRYWDDAGTVPFRCAKCHTAAGLPTFLANGGSVVVDGRGNTVTTGIGAMPPSNGLACTTCHNEADWPNRYKITSVVFPSGKTLSFGGKDEKGAFVADESNMCILCHQGRESTTSVNNALRGKEDDTPDATIGFKNIHYLAAGATVFGADAAGAYQYANLEYAGLNEHPINKCKDCHDVHALEVKVESCAACHGEVSDLRAVRFPANTTDWDGDGNVTEGVADEIATMSEKLYAAIQAYAETKAGTPIVYNAVAFPYFFVDADKDGSPDKNDKGANVSYNAWTPRLLRAAFNYQYVAKDPGAFVHNPKYVMQFLYDSIKDLGGDVAGMTRP